MIPNSVRTAALMGARSFLGCEIAEEPIGSNKGFWVELFQNKFGGRPGWAWCSYFVQYIYFEAFMLYGIANPFDKMDMSKRGQVAEVWKFAKSESSMLKIITLAEILEGDKIPQGSLFCIVRHDGTGHTGIVVSHYQNDTNHQMDVIKTIEGNSNDRIQRLKYTLADLANKSLKGVIY